VRRKSMTLCFALVFWSLVSMGTACHKQTPIVLNEDRNETRHTNGSPDAVAPTYDEWRRSTRDNQYAVVVSYRRDDSRSQFHPDQYVQAISIRPDKRLALRAMLEEIPEARQICSGGCSLLGAFTYAFKGLDNRTETLKLERQISHPNVYICRGDSKNDLEWWKKNDAYQQCLFVSFQFTSYYDVTSPPFDWGAFRIEQLNIEELRPSDAFPRHEFEIFEADDLGQWHPAQ